MIGYVIDCPSCGAHLAPHAGDHQSAPWLCTNCARGFWVCELGADARAGYRAVHHDWGHNPALRLSLHAGRAAEAEAARARGTSLLPEAVHMLDRAHLAGFLHHFRGRLAPDLAAQVERAIAAGGQR